MIEQYLKKLIEYYPTSERQSNVSRLLGYVQKHCAKYNLKATNLSFNGVHSLYISPKNKKHSKILLQAHVDVVPTSLSIQKTLIQKGDELYGRGVFDMLFAVAVYMEFIALHYSELDELDIAILLSGDEELGGFNSIDKILGEEGYTTDVCFLPDAGYEFGVLNIAAKGVYNVKVQINGVSHHGSRPWEGDGAAKKLVAFIHELEDLFDESNRDESTLTIATLQAGDASNRGPSIATADLDIRYKDKQDLAGITVALKKLLKKYRGALVRISEGNDYQLDLDNQYVQRFIAIYEKNYGKPIIPGKAYSSSDARFFSEKGMPVIMLRPDGGNAHGDNEWISRRSLQQFYKLLEQYILEVGRIGGSNE